MKAMPRIFLSMSVFLGGWLFSSSISDQSKIRFPYKAAGLNERQAAAHLLSRFTYGATPGQIDAVVKQGLTKWFHDQLEAKIPDDTLASKLKSYDSIELTNEEVLTIYPKQPQVLRMAVKEGFINKDSVGTNSEQNKAALEAYMQQNNIRPQKELYRQFINQKILRAAHTNNQLQEVMTSFWFNHFNVSLTKNDCAQFIPAYERDVVRPNSLGKFEDLLLATAKSPAMLYYLDNFSSAAGNNKFASKKKTNQQKTNDKTASQNDPVIDSLINMLQKVKKEKGLNENYAREVMELHTLGVDGGYTQEDVTQAARILTGWTVYPIQPYTRDTLRQRAQKLDRQGFVREGDFLFAANRHDSGTKTVLGKQYGPDQGYAEGMQLLQDLAHHANTAKFISQKIAVRFVNDNPPKSLVDKMAKTFLSENGDIKAVLTTMVSAPEFWAASALREKTKSPFELAIGAVRSLNATITEPYQLYNWISKMGEKMYSYQAPTGFPDKGQYWINTGALLNRMNFGLALSANKISGIKVNLPALNQYHEPESSQAALLTYSKLIMPERDVEKTVERLKPMLNDPNLTEKVDKASAKLKPTGEGDAMMAEQKAKTAPKANRKESGTMLAQVVGVIIGSPEYQRR